MKQKSIRYCLLIMATWTIAAAAQPLTFGKMSALVRQAAMEGMAARRAANGSERRMTAFVRINQNAADSVLTHHGCRKLAQWGDIVIADIPLGQLRALASEPQVQRIEAGRQATAQMDSTLTAVNAWPAFTPTSEHQAFTGEGVIVGVMDIGFDLTHPNFRDTETGLCRISAFWDQLSPDTIGSPFPVGRDYVGRAVVQAYGRSTDSDTQSHGTHTLGIAIGSGAGTPWRGLAPASDLCVVSNAVTEDTIYIAPDDRYKYTTATDALGFKYIFDYARQQGKPCVASFSEGYTPYMDAEDSLFATVLDSLTGPGRIIVASAGNESIEKTYFEKPAGVMEAGAFIRNFRKSTFYSIMTEGPVRVHLYGYCGEQGTPTDTLSVDVPDMPADSLLAHTFVLRSQDTLQVQLYREHSRFTQHDICQILISSTRPLSQVPPLALVTIGEGAAEVYGSSIWAFRDNDIDLRWRDGRVGRNILAPGCFPAVICVGATNHRLSILNVQGSQLTAMAGSQAGLISPYSSTGPSMNRLTKPDVTAPGTLVVSSLNHFHPEVTYTIDYTVDNGTAFPWGVYSGTSMSAPVVAGTIALWLQAKPTLTHQEVREVLSRTCRHPEESLTYPNNIYGYGEIDVYKGLLDVLGLTAIKDISLHQTAAIQVQPAFGGIRLVFDKAPSVPYTLTVKVYALSGHCIYSGDLLINSNEAFVRLPALPAGVFAVQLGTTGQKIRQSTLVRL